MVDHPFKSTFHPPKESSNLTQYLSIFHHNVQSLSNKLLELNALLSQWPKMPDILCFSEHWLLSDQILHLNIDQYKLADSFCRTNDKHGGSCIFVSKSIKIKEVSSLKNFGREKTLEISAIEIVKFKIIVICVYRSPNSDVKMFFNLIDEAINRVLNKGCLLVICGDLNINLLQNNSLQKTLLNLLLSNNLLNTVQSPTRVSSNSCSLIDVMIRNKVFYPTSTNVVEMGYSDHFALVMNIVIENSHVPLSEKTKRRVFSKRNIDLFNLRLIREVWDEVYHQTDVNKAYSLFLDKYRDLFLNMFKKKS